MQGWGRSRDALSLPDPAVSALEAGAVWWRSSCAPRSVVAGLGAGSAPQPDCIVLLQCLRSNSGLAAGSAFGAFNLHMQGAGLLGCVTHTFFQHALEGCGAPLMLRSVSSILSSLFHPERPAVCTQELSRRAAHHAYACYRHWLKSETLVLSLWKDPCAHKRPMRPSHIHAHIKDGRWLVIVVQTCATKLRQRHRLYGTTRTTTTTVQGTGFKGPTLTGDVSQLDIKHDGRLGRHARPARVARSAVSLQTSESDDAHTHTHALVCVLTGIAWRLRLPGTHVPQRTARALETPRTHFCVPVAEQARERGAWKEAGRAPPGAAGEALGEGKLARDVHAPQPARLHGQQPLVQARHDLCRVGIGSGQVPPRARSPTQAAPDRTAALWHAHRREPPRPSAQHACSLCRTAAMCCPRAGPRKPLGSHDARARCAAQPAAWLGR